MMDKSQRAIEPETFSQTRNAYAACRSHGAKMSKLMMRNGKHPVKVVYALAVQNGAAGIVLCRDMRPFR
ncbi:hypothetical protein HJA87_17280 [Rhizobium bangladeshense]|uniref:Uncharacterized protein n=1 Tax=Rhizobium bangladeshense TaxID=1138189 RepID=A0ABS7LJD1_9HYPH|nr:hypothetical protein [Rhizobium bangladeshense]